MSYFVICFCCMCCDVFFCVLMCEYILLVSDLIMVVFVIEGENWCVDVFLMLGV